jgi:hypothetical protein
LDYSFENEFAKLKSKEPNTRLNSIEREQNTDLVISPSKKLDTFIKPQYNPLTPAGNKLLLGSSRLS